MSAPWYCAVSGEEYDAIRKPDPHSRRWSCGAPDRSRGPLHFRMTEPGIGDGVGEGLERDVHRREEIIQMPARSIGLRPAKIENVRAEQIGGHHLHAVLLGERPFGRLQSRRQ